MKKVIFHNPRILVGKPTIRGTRIPVSLVLNLLRNGETFDGIIASYPDLTRADIRSAVAFAEESMDREETIISVSSKVAYA